MITPRGPPASAPSPRGSSRPAQGSSEVLESTYKRIDNKIKTTEIDPEILAALTAGATLVVPSAHRANALRLAYARSQLALGRTVWPSPQVLPWGAWVQRALLERLRDARGEGRQVLSQSQELLLWRQALEALQGPADAEARWSVHAGALARAAALCAEEQLTLPAGLTSECDLLRMAQARFLALCEHWQVLSAPLASAQLLSEGAVAPVFAGFLHPSARQRGVGGRWLELPPARARISRVTAPDWRGEVHAAAHWCLRLLREDPSRRLLVVSAHRHVALTLVHAALQGVLDPGALGLPGHPGAALVAVEGGEALTTVPLVRAALDLLDLALEEELPWARLSAGLMSPYRGGGELPAAIELEAWLRERIAPQVPATALAAVLGTAPGALAVAAQDLLARRAAAREALDGPSRAGLRSWAQRFAAALEAWGFPGARRLDSAQLQRLQRWQALLEELGALEGVSGPLGAQEARALLEELAQRGAHQPATGDAAITLTVELGDPLAPYDGIWVLGLTDTAWPAPPRPDAFVPLSLQREASLAAASVSTRHREGAAQLAAWRARTATLVLSHPRQEQDLRCQASPLWSALEADITVLQDVGAGLHAPGAGVGVNEAMVLPRRAEAAGGARLAAGSRVPELQHACAFAAQARLRWRAQPLAVPQPGVDPRVRGQLLHQTLERVWRALGGSAALKGCQGSARDALIHQAATAAARPLLERTLSAGDRRNIERERERTERVVREVLQLEEQRAPFEIAALESEFTLTLPAATLRVRIDRIDRLADDSLAILDYKSGVGGPLRLLEEQPEPVQLVTYLAASGGPVSALGLVRLRAGHCELAGVSADPQTLGLGRSFAAVEDWPSRSALWRSRVSALVGAFVDGEAAVDPQPRACDHCHLAALCRIAPSQAPQAPA